MLPNRTRGAVSGFLLGNKHCVAKIFTQITYRIFYIPKGGFVMIELSAFKKALGSDANDLTEEQILELRDHQDREAEIYFAMWLEKIKETENAV